MKQPRGFKVEGLYEHQIREKTQVIRNVLGYDSRPYINIMECVENLAANEIVDYEVHDDDEWPYGNDLASYTPVDNCIHLKQSTYDKAVKLNDGMSRFTIAHELGHAILHRNFRLSKSSVSSTDHEFYEDSEWQADCFAGEILIDARHFNIGDNCATIVEKFKVSPTCANVKLARSRNKKRS